MTDELVMLRTSERVTYTRCKQKWWWSCVECLTPRQASAPLRFGDLVHQALAAYYKVSKTTPQRRGPHPAKTFKILYEEQLKEFSKFGMYTEDQEWEDALSLGVEMLTNYVNEYGKDERYRVVAPEQTFQIDLDDPETGEYLVTYVGTFDAIIEDLHTKEIGLFEHKTAKTINTGHLYMDEQAGSYWAFAPDWLRSQGILKPKQDLDFILYNYLRKGKRDERPTNELGQCLNKDGTVSKNQPSPLFKRELIYRSHDDRRNTMLRVIEQAKEMAMVRDGNLPHYKSIINGCQGMFSCEFRDMCELQEAGQDWESVRDATMTHWDPYESHDDIRGEE